MKLLVGLGNPGDGYTLTRHNIGFTFVDHFAKISGHAPWKKSEKWNAEFIKIKNLIILKPLTFMNTSGQAVQKVMQFYSISPADLFVAHDDLDIHLGEHKVLKGKGPKLHGGINSIEELIGDEFWRIRLGVDNRDPENRINGEDYVLMPFADEERELVGKEIAQAILDLKAHL